MVLGAGFHRSLDVRDADVACGVQADSARAPAVPRPGVGAGHLSGRRGRPAGADSANGTRQQDRAGSGGRLSGRFAGVPADREDHRATGGQHRQGHPEDRRSLLHVLPGRVVHVHDRHGSVDRGQRDTEADLRDSDEFALACRHLCHGRGVGRRRGALRNRGSLHRRDDRLRLRRLGDGLLLPAVRVVRRRVSRTIAPTIRPTGSAPRTTPGPGRTRAVPWPMVRTAVPASRSATTRGRAPTRAVPRPTARTARAARPRAYNPRTGAVGATRQGSNVYGSWGRTGVARGDDWATTSRYTSNITGNTTRVTRTSDGDVYAGRDGNVYRKEGDSFQKYGDGGWSTVERPSGPTRPGSGQGSPGWRDRRHSPGRGRVGLEHRRAGDSRFLSARRGRATHQRCRPREQRRIDQIGKLSPEWRGPGWRGPETVGQPH